VGEILSQKHTKSKKTGGMSQVLARARPWVQTPVLPKIKRREREWEGGREKRRKGGRKEEKREGKKEQNRSKVL
jgi:hypothetical protein